jgi:hypothetical protein
VDDNTKASRTLAVRLLVVIAAFAVITIPARDAFGVRGVELSLVLAIVAIGLLAYCELTGRTPLGLVGGGRPATTSLTATPEDHWRSDRWVRETVENGWRALEEWRLEQRDA